MPVIPDGTKMCQQKSLWISASIKELVLVLCACAQRIFCPGRNRDAQLNLQICSCPGVKRMCPCKWTQMLWFLWLPLQTKRQCLSAMSTAWLQQSNYSQTGLFVVTEGLNEEWPVLLSSRVQTIQCHVLLVHKQHLKKM